jgi:hypothetical protein
VYDLKQGRTQKKISGGFEKIRIITDRSVFKNLALPAYYL